MIAEHFCATVFIWVHVIKATQYTGLKATPKNTGKKATKIYRNIGYNEYTGLKATAFLNTQEKRLHFLNIQEKRLHFSNIQEKGYTFWIYRAETCLTVHDIKSLGANTHCVCLEHYYSVDFPWWFDRKISFFSFLCKTAYDMMIGKKMLSNDRNSKLHFVIWQKNCFSLQVWTEISNQSGNQIF